MLNNNNNLMKMLKSNRLIAMIKKILNLIINKKMNKYRLLNKSKRIKISKMNNKNP